MSKIFIGAGHSNKVGSGRDCGAAANGYVEGILTVELRDLIVKELNILGITPVVDKNDSIFSETIATFRKLVSPNSITLDLHWNSGVSTAKGTETFIPKLATKFEINLAEKLSKTVSEILETPLRGKNGVKTELESHHKKLAWMGLTGENVLMEICFLSNTAEMQKYEKNKIILAKSIALVLKSFTEKNAVVVVDTKVYVVVEGDTLSKVAKESNTTIQKLIQINSLTTTSLKIGQKIKL